MTELATDIPGLRLVAPDPDRDAPFAVAWFRGEQGRQTLQLMGNPDKTITPTSLEKEKQTLRSFLELATEGKQLTWMMRIADNTIGAVWVEFADTPYLPTPAISMMIGDVSMRGKGIGMATMKRVMEYLKEHGTHTLYARHLLTNTVSAGLLAAAGFHNLAAPYEDDGLQFQNVSRDL
jgi:RimJ/RimL family protein N-acetyltransferase